MKQKLDEAALAPVREFIAAASSEVMGNEFWVLHSAVIGCSVGAEARPFLLDIGLNEREKSELGELDKVFGWIPSDVVAFAAMGNADIDHAILARLCLYTAEQLSGVVEFGANLERFTSDVDFMSSEGIWDRQHEAVAGQATEHFLSPTAFRSWIEHPDFRMAK